MITSIITCIVCSICILNMLYEHKSHPANQLKSTAILFAGVLALCLIILLIISKFFPSELSYVRSL